jgi:hypothetical protein
VQKPTCYFAAIPDTAQKYDIAMQAVSILRIETALEHFFHPLILMFKIFSFMPGYNLQ